MCPRTEKTLTLRKTKKAQVAVQFVIFKLLTFCFFETIGFDVEVSFVSRPLSRLIRLFICKGLDVDDDDELFLWYG